MLARACEMSRLDPHDFRLYRLQVKYPVISLAYGLRFPLPETPAGSASAARRVP
jgi:hypothetical protein